jgi:drug/metabolite transporter (DMT)-like permease
VTRNSLLGFAVVVFCVAGLAVGIWRVAPGSSALDIALALVAAAVGGVAFAIVLRLGRRGSPPWLKWLIVPVLIAAFYLDRLSERWQLALLALAAGYVLAFLSTVVARAARMSR